MRLFASTFDILCEATSQRGSGVLILLLANRLVFVVKDAPDFINRATGLPIIVAILHLEVEAMDKNYRKSYATLRNSIWSP